MKCLICGVHCRCRKARDGIYRHRAGCRFSGCSCHSHKARAVIPDAGNEEQFEQHQLDRARWEERARQEKVP